MTTNKKKSMKPSGHQQVVEFLNKLEHPLKKEIEEVRKIILSANNDLTEHIKWNAPSFCFDNVDRVTFNLRGNDSFLLIFHRGAKVKDITGDRPVIDDTTGLLDWVTNDRATVKFGNMDDVQNKSDSLVEIVNKWIQVN